MTWTIYEMSTREARNLALIGNLFLVKYIKEGNDEPDYDVLKFKKGSNGYIPILGNYFLSDFEGWIKIIAYTKIEE